MTEEKLGGTAPEPEASASVTNQASEQAVGTVAVADEPAATEPTPTPRATRHPPPSAGAGRRQTAEETEAVAAAAEPTR